MDFHKRPIQGKYGAFMSDDVKRAIIEIRRAITGLSTLLRRLEEALKDPSE